MQSYLSVVPSILAVVSAFAALLLGQFFRENMIAKVILVGISGLCAVGAIGATISGQHQINAAVKAQAARNKEIRDTLGNFVEEGLRLIAPGCANPAITTPPIDAIAAWEARISTFMDAKMGHSYVQRMQNLPPGFLTSAHCGNPNFNGVVVAVTEVNTHLEQFSEQANF